MEEKWEAKVKKLALAYKTGWQYRPGTDEAGSVLTDIFLEMEQENRRRYRKILEKHRRRFFGVLPKPYQAEKRRKTVLSVKAPEKSDGAWLPEDMEVYTVPAEGGLIRFRTLSALKLTAAGLRCAIYRSGFHVWLTYTAGEKEAPLPLFLPEGEQIARPDFRWYFQGLCDGREKFCFAVKFQEAGEFLPELKGEWSLRRKAVVLPLECRQSEEGIFLSGESAEFENCLDSGIYELCFCADGELGEPWLAALYSGFVLEEMPENCKPKLCLTDEGIQSAKQVLPFGRMLCEASCCYLVCDRAAAGRSGQITLHFTQRFEMEESRPATAEYKKLYKKYPWLQQTQEVLDWGVRESVWEYFNGNFWCVLPGSEGWKTGCHPEGEQVCCFERPKDMQSCIVEGEEHFFIRLRLVRVQNAYAAYYRKYIPVLEDIHFSLEERRIAAKGSKLPARKWAGEKKMYLGFDKGITSENRWYTGEGWRSFLQEQIKGWGSRFGRDAFWVELAEEKAEVLTSFYPNCVEILQVLPDEDGDEKIQGKIPASSLFFVETEGFGVLEAVSLADAAATEAGMFADVAIERGDNYFSHCGRLVTRMDLELYMQERFPQFCLVSCALKESSREFSVTVQADANGAKELLPELEAWLADLLSKVGGLWFQRVSVRCSLAEIEV